MAKSLVLWNLCLIGGLLLVGTSLNVWTVAVFFHAVLIGWVFYQKQWYVTARYYVFAGISIACLMMTMRYGPDSYVYFVFAPLVLGILSSFKTKSERFGLSLVLLALAFGILQFGFTFEFVERISSPEKYRLLFVCVTMGLCYDMTGGFLEKNREFRNRLKGMLSKLEEREARLQSNCRKEEIQVQQFEINNRKLEAVIQNRILVERGLSSSNEQLAQFSYAASHDLKEPLRSIGGFIQLIQRKVASQNDEILEQHANAIISSSTKMSKLLDDLLDYSRASKSDHVNAAVDLTGIFNSVQHAVQSRLDNVGGTLIVSELPKVFAERKLICKIFSNLLANAIENRDESRPLVVTIAAGEVVGEMVEIRVTDNGRGIDPGSREEMFELFKRGECDRASTGSGIGLSTSRKVVQSFGGEIKFISNRNKQGVTCVFTLPRFSHQLN
ncbi:MAG: ATP-binding protein [Saprospiraceae bacterium]